MTEHDGTALTPRTGGQILVDQLVVHVVHLLSACRARAISRCSTRSTTRAIAVTVCRQEGGAAMMAEAYGKLTGRPGICFVTRGPGATNASPGVHIALQDSTPMILFVGQVARGMREREAFQELDYRAVFGSIAKWATEIDDPARIPELVSRAFHVATSGRPGPVVIALPEDMLTERVAVADAPPTSRRDPSGARPDGRAAEAARGQPSGRSCSSAAAAGRRQAVRRFARFAERFGLPVAARSAARCCFRPTTRPTRAISASA